MTTTRVDQVALVNISVPNPASRIAQLALIALSAQHVDAVLAQVALIVLRENVTETTQFMSEAFKVG